MSTTISVSNVDITVTCTNDINSTSVTINDAATAQNKVLNATFQNVFLRYLFSATLVNDSTTYFYLCGVNDEFQAWQTIDLPYGFSTTDVIGQDRIFLSADRTVAVQQAILIPREPNLLTTVLLLTGIPDVNVICASNQVQQTIFFSNVLSTNVANPPSTTEAITSRDINITTGMLLAHVAVICTLLIILRIVCRSTVCA